ncbi:hypothetical protein PTQ19_10215 [Microbacterium esteraromaticum]|uniref:hypothetical protein n=1 Tax=Microbacterium esteraromaticum TaxID=57043 RepID=UPI002367F01A|nr:hypothetical protein [Microbacterium esteraromaticum]WDH77895.1 hypothetical protein PTQ19_10215 [Microbacterium esteraromaticum]
MSTLTIYGASDDLVEVEGEFDEEFGAYNGWRGRVVAPNGDALLVTAEYGGVSDYWELGIQNTGTWPSWPIRFVDRPDRDEVLVAIEIDVPAGTIVEAVER